MFKVIAIGMLVMTIVGAAGVAVYDSSNPEPTRAQSGLTATASAAAPEPVAVAENGNQNRQGSPSGTAQQQQTSNVGQPWAASGTITALDDVGFEIVPDGSSSRLYVELGPATYWQAQGITLTAGEHVMVVGYTQDGLYHAATLTKADGSQLTVRDTVSGQPLWSGGVIGGQGNASQASQTQVSAADWITVEGIVTTVAQNSLTINTIDGASLTLQMGQPGFATEQGVTFAIGDQVRVIGYDNAGQFRAGEIDNLTQGGRLMLLDPNGRPLWAGPGTGSGQSQGGQGQNGQGGQGQAGQQGQNSQNQNGQSRGYRGGRSG